MKRLMLPTVVLALAACTNDSPPLAIGGTAGGFVGDFSGTAGSPAGGFGTGGVAGGTSFDEPVVVARSTPPPLAGGTLLVTAAGHSALVADPDHDQVFVVDLDRPSLTSTITLQPGDEPGRSVEDRAGRVHVALRGGGSVVTIDPTAGVVLDRRQVCAYPRGLAYDAGSDAIHVACAGGELVTLPAGGGQATRTLQLDLDLRDVVIDGNRLLVSRFRAAELLVVEATGEVSRHLTPGVVVDDRSGPPRTFAPAVAWRTVAAPGGGALMVYQNEQVSQVGIQPGGYGGFGFGCGGSIVQTAAAIMRADGTITTTQNLEAVLPLDIATDPSSNTMVIASAGVTPNAVSPRPPVVVVDAPTGTPTNNGPCGAPPSQRGGGTTAQPLGRVVAVGFDWRHQIVLQTREPSSIMVGERAVILPGESRKDTGHDLFHFATSGGIACASCHPEGHEDGHVWTFANIGPRRTQSIGGGIMDTKPFHWDGDMTDFDVLAHEVFTGRMSGPSLGFTQLAVMEDWIDQIPAWKATPAKDPGSVERGKVLFQDAKVACASCHAGAKLTNNTSTNVGTKAGTEVGAGSFQVPSLRGLRWRAPFMHQGCAGTLADRFQPECGGGDRHGQTSQLSTAERTDLTNYLDTL